MIALLIDFDEHEDRLSYVKHQIPNDLENRVFVLGVLSEPEKLRRDINKNFEKIGEALALNCSDNTNELWGHDLLKHNKTELDRMILSVKPFLFNLKQDLRKESRIFVRSESSEAIPPRLRLLRFTLFRS